MKNFSQLTEKQINALIGNAGVNTHHPKIKNADRAEKLRIVRKYYSPADADNILKRIESAK